MTGITFSSPIMAYSGQVVAYDTTTTMPESGTAPNQFPNPIKAFSGQIRTSAVP